MTYGTSASALVSLVCTSLSFGQIDVRVRLDADGVYRNVIDDDVEPIAVTEVYDNFRVPQWNPRGRHAINGSLGVGEEEFSDDMRLIGYTGGKVSTARWTLGNGSSNQPLWSVLTSFRWYGNEGMNLLSEVHFNFVIDGIPLPPSTTGFIEIRRLESFFDFRMGNDGIFSIQFANPTGPDISELSVYYGGPTNTGSSARGVRNLTTGQFVDLGPGNNLTVGFDALPIPAPGWLGVVTAGASGVAIRRRR